MFVYQNTKAFMKRTEMIIVRHGKTAWNEEGRFQGQMDSNLTDLGIRQAEALGERLKEEEFSAVYTSDLGRAAHTAELIAKQTGHQVTPNENLRERSFGIFEGYTKSEIAEKYPEDYTHFTTEGYAYVPPGGESIETVSTRLTNCLDQLAEEHSSGRFLVVTHGGIIGRFLRIVFGLQVESPRRFRVANAGLNIFTHDGSQWNLETWGYTGHLKNDAAFKETGEALWT